MIENKVTVTFFIDASRPSPDGKCLIKLNVYQKPHKQRYATNFRLTKEEWSKLNGPKLRDEELKDIKKKLNNLKEKAEKVIETLHPFSFATFQEVFFGASSEKKSRMLDDWFSETIQKLKANDQIGTAGSYNTTINSINSFKKKLQLQDITCSFLIQYEKHLLKQGSSTSTVGIYMRNLRAIINKAIVAKVLSPESYPFKTYQIPTGQNVKKALKDFDINLLLKYEATKPDWKKALDFWIFSYLCNGMNFADIIALKPANREGDYLWFHRQKTIRTKKKDLRPIRVGLNRRARDIINTYQNNNPQNPYLFPILDKGLSATTIKYRGQRFIKWVNERMYAICSELGIEHKTSTYAARHTFSTVLKKKGVPTSFIKDALGHSTVATTENYLDSFEDDVKLEYANMLTEFQ
jgi:integrase/recombinase XerD